MNKIDHAQNIQPHPYPCHKLSCFYAMPPNLCNACYKREFPIFDLLFFTNLILIVRKWVYQKEAINLMP